MLMNYDEELLIKKYDKPVPRYTSYPTVPDWQTGTFTKAAYIDRLSLAWKQSGKEGLSLYIHLPYCESLCTYCGCNTHITVNHQVEYPYIQALLKEWGMYLQLIGDRPVIREIHLGGGTPTFFSAENLKLLIRGIVETADLAPGYEFSFEGHPNNTTYEHLKALHDIGFRRVSFGIQDFDPKVQSAINRIQTFDQVTEVTHWSRSLGYTSVNFDLIYGLPFQTEDSMLDTMAYVRELMPDRIAFYSYAHVPWKRPGQRAYDEGDLPNPEGKRRLNRIGQELLIKMGYEPIGMDHFALPDDGLVEAFHQGDLHRNFMGYTTNPGKLLIGLGVSSISDIDLAYGQNVKTVKGYLDQIQKGTLPVFKGHLMSVEDRETKVRLIEIACSKHISPKHALQLYSEKRNDLEELIRDGLLIKTAEGFDVTELGTQFLRNICTLFDPNYGQQTQKVFSQSV